MFDFAEEALDGVSVAIERSVETSPRGSRCASWNDWHCGAFGDGLNGSRPIVAFVSQHIFGLEAIKQCFDLGDIIAFPTRQDQANGVAVSIGRKMDFAADPAARAT